MRVLIALSLLTVALGGCADVEPLVEGETQEEPIHSEPVANTTLENFVVLFDAPASVNASSPFNVTFDATLPVEAATNATWAIDIMAMDIVALNSTLENATVPAYTASGNGTPGAAIFNITEVGNYTATIVVDAPGFQSANATAVFEVLGLAPMADPCADNGDGIPLLPIGTVEYTVPDGGWIYHKICLDAEGLTLKIDQDAPSETCIVDGVFHAYCTTDGDLYTRHNAPPTESTNDCGPWLTGSEESCTLSNGKIGWHYVGTFGYAGPVDIELTTSLA